MPKQIKQTRRKRRYKCQKCGEIAAVKHDKGRFQVYTKLFKSNERYDFKKDIVQVISGDKYHYTNCFWNLQKERNGDY